MADGFRSRNLEGLSLVPERGLEGRRGLVENPLVVDGWRETRAFRLVEVVGLVGEGWSRVSRELVDVSGVEWSGESA